MRTAGITRVFSIILALLLLSNAIAFAAEPGTSPSATAVPVPYDPLEFPDWQKDLRRAEIISFGALPFVTFMSSIYYDIYRYYDHGSNEAYLPWPLKKQDIAVPLSQSEQKNVFYASVGISLGVAVFDFAWHIISRNIEQSERARAAARKVPPITIKTLPSEETLE